MEDAVVIPNGTHRVVITGIGIISPVGLDAVSTWDSLINGRGASTILRCLMHLIMHQIRGRSEKFRPE